MSTRTMKFFVVTGAVAAALALAPATGSAAPAPTTALLQPSVAAAWQKGHVNSTGQTRLFAAATGDANYGYLNACTNFWYDAIINGRYRTDLGGYVSTDKAGPGWCGD
ncbi:hypothetical protein [Actinokineospora spheciospongiae]|uniref:hypothetical protein n=1 Tax=Actinokineospora spheciospongiae TaxID=909613 RepID=UPI000D8F4153|nr:hypothetical protein [Actinokineospora spheciospongiae]PWW66776.1 hypothetical protein DFQ13_101292 [Actinokineospora spheciospongiae]